MTIRPLLQPRGLCTRDSRRWTGNSGGGDRRGMTLDGIRTGSPSRSRDSPVQSSLFAAALPLEPRDDDSLSRLRWMSRLTGAGRFASQVRTEREAGPLTRRQEVVLILDFADLIADGLSMASGNYVSCRSCARSWPWCKAKSPPEECLGHLRLVLRVRPSPRAHRPDSHVQDSQRPVCGLDRGRAPPVSWENTALWTGAIRVGGAPETSPATGSHSPPGEDRGRATGSRTRKRRSQSRSGTAVQSGLYGDSLEPTGSLQRARGAVKC